MIHLTAPRLTLPQYLSMSSPWPGTYAGLGTGPPGLPRRLRLGLGSEPYWSRNRSWQSGRSARRRVP